MSASICEDFRHFFRDWLGGDQAIAGFGIHNRVLPGRRCGDARDADARNCISRRLYIQRYIDIHFRHGRAEQGLTSGPPLAHQ